MANMKRSIHMEIFSAVLAIVYLLLYFIPHQFLGEHGWIHDFSFIWQNYAPELWEIVAKFKKLNNPFLKSYSPYQWVIHKNLNWNRLDETVNCRLKKESAPVINV